MPNKVILWSVQQEREWISLPRPEILELEHLFLTAEGPSVLILPSLYGTFHHEEWVFCPETLTLGTHHRGERMHRTLTLIRYVGNTKVSRKNRFTLKEDGVPLALPSLRDEMLVSFLKNTNLDKIRFSFGSEGGTLLLVKSDARDTYSHGFLRVPDRPDTRIQVVDRKGKMLLRVERASRFLYEVMTEDPVLIAIKEDERRNRRVMNAPRLLSSTFEMAPAYDEENLVSHLGSVEAMHAFLLSAHDEICCPISKLPFRLPVVCKDGNVYERRHILRWMERSKTSPVTGKEMEWCDPTPCLFVRNAVQTWVEESLESGVRV